MSPAGAPGAPGGTGGAGATNVTDGDSENVTLCLDSDAERVTTSATGSVTVKVATPALEVAAEGGDTVAWVPGEVETVTVSPAI